MTASLCDQLIEQAKSVLATGRDPLVIFDLDGTLYDNRTRTFRILEEYAHQEAERLPELLRAAQNLRLDDVEYLMVDTLKSVDFTDENAIQGLMAYWKTCFFTDEYVELDLPIPGAATFVRRLHAEGVIPVYLTGRDAPNMLKGTVSCLHRDKFPVGTVDTRIVLKDRFERPDEEYKEAVIASIQRSGEVIAAFDNEPGLCNLFHKAFPSAAVCLLDTSHGPGAPPLDAGLQRAPDFIGLL
tara:strand:+ start:325 stop:1047 length:723 start_codon:yes stop_codon:yes gene_type:complete